MVETPSEAMSILNLLVTAGRIPSEKAVEMSRQFTNNTPQELRQLLVSNELFDEESFIQARAQVLGLPYVDLRGQTISKDILSIIPETTAREHLIIAYGQTESALKVAMAEPSDRQIVEFIHKKVDRLVEVALGSESMIREALSRYRESLESELGDVIQMSRAVAERTDDPSKAAADLPIVRIVDAILRQAIVQRASDIHIEPTEDSVIIRYRIDGLLQDRLTLPKAVIIGLVARIKVLSRLKIDEHRLPQDGRFKISAEDYKVAFRVSVLPVFDGEKVVMRLLDESGRGLRLEEIGLTKIVLEALRRSINKPHGMILVTGPTGSGKTTTLYAAMQELNTADVNISTIEDPIEYRMPRINQTQVKPQIGLTFANGLRALVRQDPDIIMVGEIRDQETASLAVNAALTGHLVLSTLHTNSAAGAVPRLMDMKVEPFLLASTLNVIMAQRLVRRLCEKCRKTTKVSKVMLDNLKLALDTEHLLEILKREKVVPDNATWSSVTVYQAEGCSACQGGYRGRTGIHEVLEATATLQQMITAHTTAKQLEEAARKEQSMVTMLEDGFIKVVNGLTTVEEVLRVAQE